MSDNNNNNNPDRQRLAEIEKDFFDLVRSIEVKNIPWLIDKLKEAWGERDEARAQLAEAEGALRELVDAYGPMLTGTLVDSSDAVPGSDEHRAQVRQWRARDNARTVLAKLGQ